MKRCNIEETEGGVRLCRGLHDKGDPCEWEYFVRKADEQTQERVKALESENETLREIVSESCAAVGSTCRCSTKASLDFMSGVPGEIRMTVSALQERVTALEEALRAIAETSLSTELSCMEYSSDTVDKWYDETIMVARKALEVACQK